MSAAGAVVHERARMQDDAAVADVVYALAATTVPEDHAEALAAQVLRWLPWLADEPCGGIHPLRTAATTGGMRVVAHRAKLVLRVPASRVAECRALCGRTLALGGEAATTGAMTERPLGPSATLYAHRVLAGAGDDRAFHDAVLGWMADAGLRGEFIVGGRRRVIVNGREAEGFALALYGLPAADSVRAQAIGIGGARTLGCGIFVPHKAIATPPAG